MHITIVNKNGEEFEVRVADDAVPVTSAWLGALTKRACGSLAFASERGMRGMRGMVTLMPPLAPTPLRTENTDRPFVK